MIVADIPDKVLMGFEPRSSDSLAFMLSTRPPLSAFAFIRSGIISYSEKILLRKMYISIQNAIQ